MREGFTESHRIGIIILNYNGADYTRACVESILRHSPVASDCAVLVVDNGSRPEDRAGLLPLESLSRVRVVSSRFNLGFGGGHLFGVQFLDADYYLFLNSDCLLLNDVPGLLARFMDAHPRAGLASGITLDHEGGFRANYHPAPHLGELLLGRSLLRRLNARRYPDRRTAPSSPLQVEVIGGAAMFVRADAFFGVGGFDPFFFLYCEEEDLSLRMRRAGWEAWVIPNARIEHEGGASTPDRAEYRQEFFISFLHYLRKHHRFVSRSLIRVIYVLKLLRRVRREPGAARLAWFVLTGANPSASLRFRAHRR